MKKRMKIKKRQRDPFLSSAIKTKSIAVNTAPEIDDDNTKFDINN